MSDNFSKLIRQSDFVAEVEIELIDSETGWSPSISLEDAYKLDDVRLALRAEDIKTASRISKVYSLTPVSGEN